MSIEKIELGAPESQSADLRAENLAKLRALFPELVTEGPQGVAVNVDVLKGLVGDATVTDADEKYGLNWHGKRAARQLALTPSTGTLRPCPDESVDWDTTQNLMIEGDNLEVLKLLQKSYAGKVKLIYIDPPYNTGKDFIYSDSFQNGIGNYFSITGQVEDGKRISSGIETNGRFHTDWLGLMYPRLALARSLLRKDGVIFVSIDDREVANLRGLLDEIFGSENFCATFVWNTEGNTDNQYQIKVNHEYVIAYYKDVDFAEPAIGRVVDPNTREDSNLWRGFADNNINKNNPENPPSVITLPAGFPCAEDSLFYPKKLVDGDFFAVTAKDKFISDEVQERYGIEKKSGLPVKLDDMVVEGGRLVAPCRIYVGVANKNKLQEFIDSGCVPIEDDGAELSFYINSNAAIRYKKTGVTPRNILSVLRGMGTTERSKTALKNMGVYYDYPKPLQLMEYLIRVGCNVSDGVVLDFFAGSGTTAHAVMNVNREDSLNRRFICVQLPERTGAKSEARARGFSNLAEICGKRLEIAAAGLSSPEVDLFKSKCDVGFRVFKLDESNTIPWRGVLDFEGQVDNFLLDRTEEDFLYEILLKLGLDLCVPIEQKIIADKMVYSVGGGVLMACLESPITPQNAEPLALGITQWRQDQQTAGDTTCIFRDSAFTNDVAKTNLAAILEQHGIAKVRSL